MRHTLLLLISLLLMLPAACTRPCPALDEARALMATHPDSALTLLRTIDPQKLQSDKQKALYSLLYSQAKDKNALEVQDDDIAAAYKYFSKSPKQPFLMMAQYYNGRALYHSGKHANSLKFMYEAYDKARSLNDAFWIGMSARGIAENYNATMNSAEELKYRRISYDSFQKSNKSIHSIYALFDLGIALHNTHNYAGSIEVYEQVIDSAVATKNNSLHLEALQMKSRALFANEEYGPCIAAIRQLEKNNCCTAEDSAYLGISLAELNRTQESEDIFNRLSGHDDKLSQLLNYRIGIATNDTCRAFSALNKLHSSTNEIFADVTTTDISSNTIDYYYMEKRAKEAELKESIMENKLMTFSIIFTIILAAGIVYTINRRKQERINSAINLANEFETALVANNNKLDHTKTSIKNVLDHRLKPFDKISNIIFQNIDSEIPHSRMAKIVLEALEELKPGADGYKELEDYVDVIYDNIMSNLKGALPNLKPKDYAVFLYTILGFSLNSISVITGEDNINSIYNRKRRLKNKINTLDNRIKEAILAHFS